VKRPFSQLRWTYHPVKGGHYLPYINARIQTTLGTSGPLPFLVDTGSLFSYAPWHYRSTVVDTTNVERVFTKCEDLGGSPVDGFSVQVELILLPSTRVVKEAIFFRDKPEMTYAVLGHQSFLRQFPALFWTGNRNGSLTLFNV